MLKVVDLQFPGNLTNPYGYIGACCGSCDYTSLNLPGKIAPKYLRTFSVKVTETSECPFSDAIFKVPGQYKYDCIEIDKDHYIHLATLTRR